MRLFRRRKKSKEPLTLVDAIAKGLVPVPVPLVPISGFWVRDWDKSLRFAIDVYYPSWQAWRNNRRSLYLGGRGILEYRDIPSGIREPMIDLGGLSGATVEDYNAAKGFLLDKGLVRGTDHARSWDAEPEN